jgi:hypothetical protein
MGTLYPKVKAMVCLVLISMISTTDSLRAEFASLADTLVSNAYEEGWVVNSTDALCVRAGMESRRPRSIRS